MQQYAIRVGPVGLKDFEVPNAVSFGGQQRVSVHRLFGGSRVVQSLGAESNTICFEGAFTGADADARFRTVDSLRLSGEPVWLSWGNFRHAVIVQMLHAQYRSPWCIQFRINCIAATELVESQSPLTMLAELLASDLQNAAAGATLAGFSIGAVQSALAARQTLISGTSDRANAIGAVTCALTGKNQTILTASTFAASPEGLSDTPPTAASAFLARIAACGSLAGSVATRGYLARIGTNLAGVIS